MSMTAKRRTEVFGFLDTIDEDIYSAEEFRKMEITGPEIAQYLIECDKPNVVPELNVGLLREQITWARKSYEVKEPFAHIGWQQSTWLETEFASEPVTVQNEDGIIQGFVADNFCNTAGCIAGSVAIRCGEPLWQKNVNGDRYKASWMKTGELIEDFAKDQLGLTFKEARIMFDENATIEFLEAMAEGVCLRRGLEY